MTTDQTPATPAARAVGKPQGTSLRIGDHDWVFAATPPALGGVWDRIYDDNLIRRGYRPHDLAEAALALLLANYALSLDEAVRIILETSPESLVPAVEAALFGAARRHSRYSDWVAASLLANGLDPDRIPPDRLRDVMEILEETGRTVPERDFISSLAAIAKRHSLIKGFGGD